MPGRFIDECPLDQAQLQLIDIMNPAAPHALLQLPKNQINNRLRSRQDC